MRRGISLLTLGIGWVLLATASCGTDEATGSSTGHTAYCKPCSHTSDCANGNECRTVLNSLAVCAKASDTMCCDGADCYPLKGSGGSGGSAGGGIIGGGGKGGSSNAGKGGTGGSTAADNFGRACVNDTDCVDPALTCVTPTSIAGDGPPHGMCTLSCSSSTQCANVVDNAYCVPWESGHSYCTAACTEGDSPKCGERDDVTCTLIGDIPGTAACATTDDCQSGEICDSQNGVCAQIVTGCMPLCGGDYDCTPDQFCDFASGLCTSSKPTGLPVGSPCTEPTGNEQDPCNGFCLAKSQGETKGECSAFCSVNSGLIGCGWDGKGAAENGCVFGTIISASEVALGDVGICGKLCDCNADCQSPGDYCVDDSGGNVMTFWGRPGYCRPLNSMETEKDSFTKCPGGSGGTGGMTSTGGTGATEAGAGAGAGGQGGS